LDPPTPEGHADPIDALEQKQSIVPYKPLQGLLKLKRFMPLSQDTTPLNPVKGVVSLYIDGAEAVYFDRLMWVLAAKTTRSIHQRSSNRRSRTGSIPVDFSPLQGRDPPLVFNPNFTKGRFHPLADICFTFDELGSKEHRRSFSEINIYIRLSNDFPYINFCFRF
jgi:hypothetical protein